MTKNPCECDVLWEATQEPDHPVQFDERLNEFSINWAREGGSASAVLRYCYWCGGRLSKTKRDQLFHIITPSERNRLTKLTEGIASVQDAIEKLGPADADHPNGYSIATPERDGKPGEARSYRTVVFGQHSAVADISLMDLQEKGISFSFVAKPLDEPETISQPPPPSP